MLLQHNERETKLPAVRIRLAFLKPNTLYNQLLCTSFVSIFIQVLRMNNLCISPTIPTLVSQAKLT